MIYSHTTIGHWIRQTLGCSNLNQVLWFIPCKILTTVPRKVNPRKEKTLRGWKSNVMSRQTFSEILFIPFKDILQTYIQFLR